MPIRCITRWDFTLVVAVNETISSRPAGPKPWASAARAALAYAFGPAGLDEIVSFTATTNLPSQRVMQRIGMVHDEAGDFDHPRIEDGHRLQRHVLYRITRAQWESTQ